MLLKSIFLCRCVLAKCLLKIDLLQRLNFFYEPTNYRFENRTAVARCHRSGQEALPSMKP